VSSSGYSYQYAYNGLGDRLQSTLNGVATNYSLDLNSGLTQVLADGTNTYTYGLNRIAQTSTDATGCDLCTPERSERGYFLDDAIGSARQLTDDDAKVTLSQSYSPYGEVIENSGEAETNYGFTPEKKLRGQAGEQVDASGSCRTDWSTLQLKNKRLVVSSKKGEIIYQIKSSLPCQMCSWFGPQHHDYLYNKLHPCLNGQK